MGATAGDHRADEICALEDEVEDDGGDMQAGQREEHIECAFVKLAGSLGKIIADEAGKGT
jgi:hypothetical protein